MLERIETLRKLVSVNETFSNRVDREDTLEVALYVKFEIALLFFKLNKKELSDLGDEANLVWALLRSNDYVLENEYVVLNGVKYLISAIIGIVEKIKVLKEVRTISNSDKIIEVDFRKNDIKEYKREKAKIYDIGDILKDTSFTYEERAYILERTTRIDKETLPFIEENHFRFVSRMNEMIYSMLSGEGFEVNDNYFRLLMSYIKMYPFVEYGRDLVSLENLEIPQNEIGLTKCVITDSFIKKLEEYVHKLKRDRSDYVKQFFDFDGCEGRLKKIAEIAEFRVREIDKNLHDCSYNYCVYVHDRKVYNVNVLSYLFAAVGQGNVYMSSEESNNPVVKFFVVDKGIIVFFCGMRLEIFMRLIDSGKLIVLEDDFKPLEKKKS